MDKGHISIQINHIGIVKDIKENYLLEQNHYEICANIIFQLIISNILSRKCLWLNIIQHRYQPYSIN